VYSLISTTGQLLYTVSTGTLNATCLPALPSSSDVLRLLSAVGQLISKRILHFTSRLLCSLQDFSQRIEDRKAKMNRGGKLAPEVNRYCISPPPQNPATPTILCLSRRLFTNCNGLRRALFVKNLRYIDSDSQRITFKLTCYTATT